MAHLSRNDWVRLKPTSRAQALGKILGINPQSSYRVRQILGDDATQFVALQGLRGAAAGILCPAEHFQAASSASKEKE